jgi:hypothetical protein
MTISTETLTDICNMLAEGKSLRAICREMDFAESSVRRWLVQDADAMAHSAHARELGCDALADECLQIADAGGDPADKRIRIDTRIRLIGKWSQRYSDKLTVNNNTTVTHKHDLGSLSTDELEQLETILAKSERGASDTGAALASSVH